MFENDACFFFWKPHNIASSWGKEACFLDLFSEEGIDLESKNAPNIDLDKNIEKLIEEKIRKRGITQIQEDEQKQVINTLKRNFDEKQEYGLLNRLDTATAGFLYFAKNQDVYSKWKQRQSNNTITKYYIAVVYGKPEVQTIDIPLGHHKNNKRMIVLDQEFLNSRRKQKMRGKTLDAETKITHVHDFSNIFDTSTDCKKNVKLSLIHLEIKKGQRHQIRAHLGHLGYSIVGETIYTNHDSLSKNEVLQLYSVGCKIDE